LGAKREDRLGSLERLDLRLFVEADNHGLGGRVQVEADDIADLGFGIRVGGELERLDAMRLHSVSLPDPVDGGMGDTDAIRDFARAPMRESRRRGLERQGDDPGTFRLGHRRRVTGARLVSQSCETFLSESSSNTADLNWGVPRPTGDFGAGKLLSEKNDTRATGESGRRRGRSLQPLERTAFGFRQVDGPRVVGHGP